MDLPDDCSNQDPQNTKTGPSTSLHSHNEQLLQLHIQNWDRHWNYLQIIVWIFNCIRTYELYDVIWSNIPSQSTTMGLFAALYVLRTKTAFVAGDVVVAGTVTVVISGDVVVSSQA